MPSKKNRNLAASYIWDIADFASLAALDDSGILLHSPLFNKRSIDEVWKLHIYPNGKSDDDYIGFYICKMSRSNQGVYNFTLSVGRPNSTPVKSCKYIEQQFVGLPIGEERFLCKKSNGWMLKGPVRFRCDITKIGLKNHNLTHACLNSYVSFGIEDTSNLSTDLKTLLKIPFHSDLTVNLNENVMHIHKYILFATRILDMSNRSEYSNVMELPPDMGLSDQSFKLLMNFIYTGKLGDSFLPLDLFRYAVRSGLSSLIQCAHEQICSCHLYSEGEVEEKFINWKLDELEFPEKALTCVHILRTVLYAEKLAIQVNISDGFEHEKLIDVSLKFFRVHEARPIILICKISLTSKYGIEYIEEKKHVFLKEEQWNFPQLLCQKDKDNWLNLGMRLKVELRMSEWSNFCKKNGIKTKTNFYTIFQTITDNLTYLSSSLFWLFQIAQSTSNLVLLSNDNKFFRVHDGIMWARWPGVKKLLSKNSDSSDEEITDFVDQLELKLPSDVLNILLIYFYTGFIASFDKAKAELLLKYSSELEFPDHLIEKCKALLSVNDEN